MQAKQAALFQQRPFVLEKTNKLQLLNWEFCRYFLKNESNELSLHEKQLTVIVANGKIQHFKQKLKFWKNYIHYCEFNNLINI